jgi:actin-like ATPase involved in cell morphogenesis
VMAGKPYGAEALMGHLLRHVVAAATADGGAPPDEIVLTHPAVWGDYKLDLLREAGRQAGAGEITLMPEPVAAALHYVARGRLAAGDVVAVYDFGGGTFDAAVVQCTERGAEILGAPQGLERLGGVDLDQIVVLHVNEALDGRLRELDTTDPEGRRAVARLRAECTAAKEALSSDTEVSIPVALPGLHTEVRITRDEFEAAARSRVADTLGALDRAIADAAVDPSTLAGVLLVGGSSRIPVVAEEVGRRTGRPTLLDADPKLVVALGAAGGSTVMTPTRNTGPADAAEGSSGAATPPPPPPPPPPPASRPGAPGAPLSASAQAGARAAALRAAANTGKPPSKGKGATVAGAVGAAAAAAAAGYATYEYLIDNDESDKDDKDKSGDEASEAEDLELLSATDDSMDAFDDLGGGIGARLGGGGGRGFGGGGGGGGAERVVVRERPAPPRRGEKPDAEPELADIGEARAELLERFAAWEPPAGADAAEVAAFRTEIEGLINRYQPREGMSANDALAELRQQFDDQVEDFVQDLKLDAVIEDRDDPPATPAEPAGPHWEWNDEKDRWEWDRGSEHKPAEPHWEWDADKGQWEWDDGPDPLPPTRDGWEWIPAHRKDDGEYVSGHWDRPQSGGIHDRPGFDWVPEHVDEYGRRVPAHWEREQALRPEPAPMPTEPEPPIGVPMPETVPVRTWVEGHYDEHGRYVKGHWQEVSAENPTPKPLEDDPPPIIDNPPEPPTAPPTAPPMSPIDPPDPVVQNPYPDPTPPPVVRDHRDERDDDYDRSQGGRVVVRDHRGDRDRVRPTRRRDDGDDDRSGGANVRDDRPGAEPAPQHPQIPGVPGQVLDVFEQALPSGAHLPYQPMVARQDPPPDTAAARAVDPTAAAASTAAAEAARTTPAASAERPAPEPAPAPAGTAEPPADDLLGEQAFAEATQAAPELELAAEIPPPAPFLESAPPEPAPAATAPAPEPAAPAPAPEVTVVADPIPAAPATDFANQANQAPEPDRPADDDEAPSDLDNNITTPL